MSSCDVDSRGIRRGQCNVCPCDGYSSGTIGFKCVKCYHFPAKHENLSFTASADSAAVCNPSIAPVSPRTSNTAIEQSSGSSDPCCRVPDCSVEAYYDLNVSRQYPLCYDHLTTLPAKLRNLYISESDNDHCVPGPQLQTISPSHSVPKLRPRSPIPPVRPTTVHHGNVDPEVSLPLNHRQSSTSSSDLDYQSVMQAVTQMFVPSAQFAVRSPSPHPPGIQQAASPQPRPISPRPLAPLDSQCKLPGCTRPRYKDENGKEHDCCGRTHSIEYRKLQSQGTAAQEPIVIVPPELKCMNPSCNKQRYRKEDGSGYFDYCGRTCMRKSETQETVPESDQCMLPGCTKPKYRDVANQRVHDYCGRGHAYEAQKRGIALTGKITLASPAEFKAVSTKFSKMWARQKGSCPQLRFVFVVNNTTLEQRWKAYQQKLRIKTVEEYYHGTMLKCNVTNDRKTCSDQNCGICGISLVGLDRRCIQKNIAFQRFGHGFYLAPNSSKCHDYTQGSYSYRAMLLCHVVPGKKYERKSDCMNFTSPPPGYDSVYGRGAKDSSLNYDELVVYNPDCVLPRYVLVYQKDGEHKIAK